MNTLWAFGDSFTDYYKPPTYTKRHWRHKYIEWKGYDTKVYAEFIAEKLDMKLVNKGFGGCDNSFIFEEFCKVCDKIKKDDIVIFGWTNPIRFKFAYDNNWGFFCPEPKNKNAFHSTVSMDKFEFLSENTIKEILISRDSEMFINELSNWIKLINYSLKDINFIHWSWYSDLSRIGVLMSPLYKSIKDETGGVVDDGHWCEAGHEMFSNILIQELSKKNKKKLI